MEIFDKAISFSEALFKHALNGFKNTGGEEYQKRISACFNCKSNKDWTCDECKCLIQLKAKWATEDCPLGKWPKPGDELPASNEQQSPIGGCGCGSRNTTDIIASSGEKAFLTSPYPLPTLEQ